MQKLVYWIEQQQLNWMLLEQQGQQAQVVQSGSLLEGEPLPDCFTQLRDQCLLLPGTDVALKTIEFSAAERRHILKAVPYLLEESLPVESEELTIVCAKPQTSSVQVAYCSREWLQHYAELASQFDLKPSQVVPEQLFFSELVNQDCCLAIGNRAILLVEGQSFSFEQSQLELILQQTTENELTSILLLPGAQLDSTLAGFGRADELRSSEGSFNTSIDFVQHGFAAKIDWPQLFRFSRPILIAASIAAVLLTTVLWLQHSSLKQQNLELRRGIEQEFRLVQPSGVIYQPKSKMTQMLAAYGASQGSGFSEVFNKITKPLAELSEKEIQSLTWDGKTAELKLELILADFDALQALQKNMVEQQLKVELQNSNAQGERLQARLKIRRAG